MTGLGGGGGGGGCAPDDLGALGGTVTRTGNLGDDCVSPNYSGRLARYYSFTLGQSGPVEIDLVSSAFDAFVALREGTDAAGRLVVTDDDGGQGTNSRIERDLSAGTYTIEATSYATGVTGAFTLTVTGSGGGATVCFLHDLGALSGTVTRTGNLGDDCASPNYPGRLARYYRFALGQSGPVEIDLVSSAFDTFLALREGAAAGRLVATDDDGGQGTNSRIVADLSAGTYTIEATSYATGVTGAFTLTVTGSGGRRRRYGPGADVDRRPGRRREQAAGCGKRPARPEPGAAEPAGRGPVAGAHRPRRRRTDLPGDVVVRRPSWRWPCRAPA